MPDLTFLRFPLLALVLFVSPTVQARIIRIEITSRESPTFGGKSFGRVGAYEKLRGKAYGELDPNSPQNALITDIQLAPRNAKGMVEYAMDMYILKPIDLTKGSHKLFLEVNNRGGKLVGGLNKSSGGNDPTTDDPCRGRLFDESGVHTGLERLGPVGRTGQQ